MCISRYYLPLIGPVVLCVCVGGVILFFFFVLFVVSHLSFRFWLHFFLRGFVIDARWKRFWWVTINRWSMWCVIGTTRPAHAINGRRAWNGIFDFILVYCFFFCLFSVGLISNHGVAIYFHFTRCFIIRWIRIRWMKVKGIYSRINIYIEHRLQSPNKYDYIFCAADSLSIIDNHLSPNHFPSVMTASRNEP